MHIRSFFIIFFLLILVSCQDEGGLLPDLAVEDKGLSLLELPVSGTVLAPLGVFPLGYSSTSGTLPSRIELTFTLLGASSTQISETVQDETGTSSVPLSSWAYGLDDPFSSAASIVVKLPDLMTGTYSVACTAYSSSTLLETLTRTVFVEKNLPAIEDVQVFPSVVKSGGIALLYADLSGIGAEAAYVRWSSSEGLTQGQVVSGTTAECQITAPDRKGIYTYAVEVFPRAPSGGAYDFDAPIKKVISLVVDDKSMAGANDFKPETDFPVLLHMNGSFDDSGTLAAQGIGPQLSMAGSVSFGRLANQIGFRLGSASYLSFPDSSLFRDGKNGGMANLNLVLDLVFSDLKPGVILSTKTQDGQLSCTVQVSEGLFLSVAYTIGSSTLQFQGSTILTEGHCRLFLGAGIQDGVLRAIAVSGTDLMGEGSLDVSSVVPSSEADVTQSNPGLLAGQTWIGSVDGPVFILDEFGLYDPVSAGDNYDPFYQAMRFAYGSGLVLADSFLGPYLSSVYGIKGDVRIANGKLLIPGGASLSLPLGAIDTREVDVLMGFTGDSRKRAVLTITNPSEDYIPVKVQASGLISQGRKSVEFKDDSTSLQIRLARSTDTKIKVRVGKSEIEAELGKTGNSIVISIGSDQDVLVELSLDSILALYKEQL